MRYLGMRTLTQFLAGHHPGPDGGDHQAVLERVPPASSPSWPSTSSAPRRSSPTGRQPSTSFQTDDAGAPNSSASWVDTFLNARAGTIYAGSSQIQRNIIGEMVLGLPKEPRPGVIGASAGACRRGRRRPSLWPTARPPVVAHGRRRVVAAPPFLPVPARRVPAFRRSPSTAIRERRASPADVVNYLAWCRAWAVKRRRDEGRDAERARPQRQLRAAQRRPGAPGRLPRARRQGRRHRGRRHRAALAVDRPARARW